MRGLLSARPERRLFDPPGRAGT